MTPIVNAAVGTPEYNYTRRHIQTRNSIERCIGLLKSRFQCLSNKLRYSPQKVGNIINVCGILHNICIEGRLNFEINEPNMEDDPPILQNILNNNGPVYREGDNVRRNLIRRYFN